MGWPNNYAEYAYDSNGNVVGLVSGTKTLPLISNANTISFIGDSMFGRGQTPPPSDYSSMALPLPTSTTFPTPTSYIDRGIVNWCMVATNQKLKLIRNAGVGGNRTQHILARIDSDVLAESPRYVAVMAGYNNIVNGDSFAQITSDLTSIYGKIRGSGAKLIAFTILPNSTYINATATRVVIYNQVNRWIKQYCISNDGCICFDAAEVLTDVATGGELSGMLAADNIHPVGKAGITIGNYFGTIINPLLPSVPDLIGNTLDASAGTNAFNGGNILLNARMTGTAGTNNGTGMSGNVATSWTHQLEYGTATSVASKVARTDGILGEWQQVAISSMTGSSGVRLQRTSSLAGGPFVIGDTLSARAEVQLDSPTSLRSLQLVCEFLNSGYSTISSVTSNQISEATTYPALNGTLTVPNFVVPALTAYIVFKVVATGNTGTVATFRVGRCEMRTVV